MGFKIPGIGIFFVGLGIPMKKPPLRLTLTPHPDPTIRPNPKSCPKFLTPTLIVRLIWTGELINNNRFFNNTTNLINIFEQVGKLSRVNKPFQNSVNFFWLRDNLSIGTFSGFQV